MEVGQTVAQSRPQVQQRRRGSPGYPGVAVRGSGGHTFEEREDPLHLGHVVQGGDEVHLGGSRVGEADIDTRAHQSGQERPRPVHAVSPLGPRSRSGPRIPKGSKTRLIERMRSRFTVSTVSRKYDSFSVPMPCSPETAPPAAMAVS